jgi:hypothetical protein
LQSLSFVDTMYIDLQHIIDQSLNPTIFIFGVYL